MEITKEEEAQLHTLSDSELAAVFAMVSAAEFEGIPDQESDMGTQIAKPELTESIGEYTIVQRLRTRLRQLRPSKRPINDSENS